MACRQCRDAASIPGRALIAVPSSAARVLHEACAAAASVGSLFSRRVLSSLGGQRWRPGPAKVVAVTFPDS
jgi:hypothetical protein